MGTDKRKSIIKKQASHRLQEVVLIIASCLSLFLLLSLATYHRLDPSWSTVTSSTAVANLGGEAGAWVADLLLYYFGYVAYLFPFIFAGLIALSFRDIHETSQHKLFGRLLKLIGFVFFISGATGLLELLMPIHAGVPLDSGGVIGEIIAPVFHQTFSSVGGSLLLLALFLAGITCLFGVSWLSVSKAFLQHSQRQLFTLVAKLKAAYQARKAERATVATSEKAVPEAAYLKKVEKPVKKQLPKTKKKPDQKTQQTVPVSSHEQTADLSQDSPGKLPSLELLDSVAKSQRVNASQAEIDNLAQSVEARLEEFGITVKVVAVYPGPVVTRFELELSPGMKAGKITALAKDLARSLSVPSVRIVEVIPGKSVVGLEIPNEQREPVRLREILEGTSYQRSESSLSLGLGKDIAGHPVVIDVAKMPHLLVAGTTGAGKSVSVNAMILSLLLKASPEEVRMIMIDPKMLELSIYEGIPHLLSHVVTNMKEAANALRWCVAEMDRRYRLMAALSVRNLASFNSKIKAAKKQGKPIKDPFYTAADGDSDQAPELEPLPKVVVVVDELADMMMVVGKKVEELIARIAQKARAAGIHMILATQRPSVDVITGLIKANIPCRIAFNVSSRVDSRTILDQQGAENLLGNGDMLYLPPGTSLPIRVHGAFVADEEVLRVVAAWKKRAEPDYLDEILEGGGSNDSGDSNGFGLAEEDNEQDPLYDKAVAIVTTTRKASISMVQRRLKIGYNRAARIVEAMEEAGVVSAMENGSSREVLAPPPPQD